VSPVKYELGFYIPADDILHSDCREGLKSCKLCNVERPHTAQGQLGGHSSEDLCAHCGHVATTRNSLQLDTFLYV
jgi:hypothetical protein